MHHKFWIYILQLDKTFLAAAAAAVAAFHSMLANFQQKNIFSFFFRCKIPLLFRRYYQKLRFACLLACFFFIFTHWILYFICYYIQIVLLLDTSRFFRFDLSVCQCLCLCLPVYVRSLLLNDKVQYELWIMNIVNNQCFYYYYYFCCVLFIYDHMTVMSLLWYKHPHYHHHHHHHIRPTIHSYENLFNI